MQAFPACAAAKPSRAGWPFPISPCHAINHPPHHPAGPADHRRLLRTQWRVGHTRQRHELPRSQHGGPVSWEHRCAPACSCAQHAGLSWSMLHLSRVCNCTGAVARGASAAAAQPCSPPTAAALPRPPTAHCLCACRSAACPVLMERGWWWPAAWARSRSASRRLPGVREPPSAPGPRWRGR